MRTKAVLICAIGVALTGCLTIEHESHDGDERWRAEDGSWDRHDEPHDDGDWCDDADAGAASACAPRVGREVWLAEIYAPKPVSDCISGATFPVHVTYYDTDTETEPTTYEVLSGDADLDQLEDQTSSKTDLLAPLEGMVWAGAFGMWYRQRKRYVAEWDVVTFDENNRRQYGRVRAHEHHWNVGLSVGPTCPPPPRFAPAECRLPPCGPY